MPSYLLGAGSLLLLISAFVVTAIFYSTDGCAVVSISTMNSISSMMCCEPEYQIWAAGVIACVTLSLFAIPQVWDVIMWHGAEGCREGVGPETGGKMGKDGKNISQARRRWQEDRR